MFRKIRWNIAKCLWQNPYSYILMLSIILPLIFGLATKYPDIIGLTIPVVGIYGVLFVYQDDLMIFKFFGFKVHKFWVYDLRSSYRIWPNDTSALENILKENDINYILNVTIFSEGSIVFQNRQDFNLLKLLVNEQQIRFE